MTTLRGVFPCAFSVAVFTAWRPRRHRERWVWSFQVAPDGALLDGQPFYRFETPDDGTAVGAAGMTVDSEGFLYVATRLGIQAFDQPGRVNAILGAPSPAAPLGLVFAGKDLALTFTFLPRGAPCVVVGPRDTARDHTRFLKATDLARDAPVEARARATRHGRCSPGTREDHMNRCPIVLAVFLAVPAALVQAAEDGVAVYAQSMSFVAQGRLREAEATLRRAVSIDEGTTDAAGRARLAGGLDLLASLVGNRGERAESESLLRRALHLAEAAPRLPDADVAHALVALGQALAARGAGREAEKLASRAVNLYEKTSPRQRAEVIDALNLVAALHAARGDLDAALTVLRRAVRVGELENARAGLKAMTLSHLGSVRLRQRRLQEAEPLLEQGLELGEVSIGGKDHPALVRMMQMLADCYRFRGRADDAEALYTRALAIADRTYGPHSSTAVASLSGLGHVAEARGDDARAEAWHREALEAAESGLPPEDPIRAELLGNLAALYARQGEEGAAEHLYLRAMAALEHARGGDDRRSEVLEGLASLYAGQGRRADAARIRRALDRPRASYSGAAPSAFSAENP